MFFNFNFNFFFFFFLEFLGSMGCGLKGFLQSHIGWVKPRSSFYRWDIWVKCHTFASFLSLYQAPATQNRKIKANAFHMEGTSEDHGKSNDVDWTTFILVLFITCFLTWTLWEFKKRKKNGRSWEKDKSKSFSSSLFIYIYICKSNQSVRFENE